MFQLIGFSSGNHHFPIQSSRVNWVFSNTDHEPGCFVDSRRAEWCQIANKRRAQRALYGVIETWSPSRPITSCQSLYIYFLTISSTLLSRFNNYTVKLRLKSYVCWVLWREPFLSPPSSLAKPSEACVWVGREVCYLSGSLMNIRTK